MTRADGRHAAASRADREGLAGSLRTMAIAPLSRAAAGRDGGGAERERDIS